MEALKGITREKLGSSETRRLRHAGMIPGIIYGHGEENIPFAMNSRDLNLVLQHGERLVKLALGKSEGNYLIKAVQRDAFDNEVIHVDFTRVNLDESVEVTVALTLKGTPAGEAEGGITLPGIAAVTIEVPVISIPEEIVVRLNDLALGDSLRVSDLPPLDAGAIISDGGAIIATCQLPIEAPEEEEEAEVSEAEEGAEPEVIGKGKAEEEETEGK